MDFFEVVDTQRAIRRFRGEPVEDELLARVLSAATRAPSARGAEPWGFVVVRDAGRRAAIASLYRQAWEAADAFTRATDADRDVRDRPHYTRMMAAAGRLATTLADAPVLIVCCLDHAQLGPIRSPVAAYASILPAAQNLCLAARALGLGTTLTTLHTAFEPQLKAVLAIPPAVEPVVLVPLGWPSDRFGPTRRRPVNEVAYLDAWGAPLPMR